MAVPSLKIFDRTVPGTLVSRLNRFVVECSMRGGNVRAHLPNPGRLRELLLPGRRVWLVPTPPASNRTTRYTCVAVEREGAPIMLHTHHSNTAAQWLIDRGMIPGLHGYHVLRREVTEGASRFDFLVSGRGNQLLLEVKSCTLLGGRIAMFPDAVTERGRRHLVELARRPGGRRGAVLFLVHSPRVDRFLPDYHTDLAFAETLLAVKDTVRVMAVAVRWNRDLSLAAEARDLSLPWSILRQEARDRGSYMLVLHIARSRSLAIGDLGKISFRKGYYIYIGSAEEQLSRRIDQHRRTGRRPARHIDYLREQTEWVEALSIRAQEALTCVLADEMARIAGWSVSRFGTSGCGCPAHLFGMTTNPLQSPAFIDLVEHFRIRRLEPMITSQKQLG